MNKVFHTGDQDELVKAAGQIVVFFEDIAGVKSAASNSFSEQLMRQHMPDDDHFGSLLIAMGCGEDYGFNKNGDWWTRDGLVKRCNTFVTHGHFFREHRNRDPKLKIGDIKAAAYNHPQQRVELIIWGDKRKAEPEYERAKAGKASYYSMSARVPDDECSICGNRAKRASLYCDDLKNHMTQWMPRHRKFAFAINHKPTFFDISDVANPADRIAHSLQYLWSGEDEQLAKAATALCVDGFMFSELQAKAAGVILPDEEVLGYSSSRGQQLLEQFAEAEEFIDQAMSQPNKFAHDDLRVAFLKRAVVFGFDPNSVNDSQIEALRSVEPEVFLHLMAKQAAVMPFLPFYCYMTGQQMKQASEDPVYQYASDYLLPTMFRDAAKRPADPEVENLFVPASLNKAAACGVMPESVQTTINQFGQEFSIDAKVAKARIMRICADTPDSGGYGVKSASGVTDNVKRQAQTFTNAYAMYKVAFAEASAELRGNSIVDDAATLLITYPYRA